jgi:hypothetical protein
MKRLVLALTCLAVLLANGYCFALIIEDNVCRWNSSDVAERDNVCKMSHLQKCFFECLSICNK